MTADDAIRGSPRAALVARVIGATFIVAGAVKFLAFGWEVDNFRRFALPAAPAWVVAAGVIEIAGGALLVRRQAVVPAAALLVITMAVAIAVSGIAHGDVIPSLTLAPVLLGGLLFIIRQATRPEHLCNAYARAQGPSRCRRPRRHASRRIRRRRLRLGRHGIDR